MCNNNVSIKSRTSKEERIKKLTECKVKKLEGYAVRIFTGESRDEIARKEHISVEELNRQIEEIKSLNPVLYEQLTER
jgi:hypothetical protein